MKFLKSLFGKRHSRNMVTTLERQRLSRTMPGQSAAMAGARLGVLV